MSTNKYTNKHRIHTRVLYCWFQTGRLQRWLKLAPIPLLPTDSSGKGDGTWDGSNRSGEKHRKTMGVPAAETAAFEISLSMLWEESELDAA